MPEVKMPEHVRLLIAWIRLIIARGAFGDDKSHMSLLPYDLMFSRIEQICTYAFAEPNEYIRILIEVNEPYHFRIIIQENERFSKDRYIILAAVRWDGCVLEYASPELRGDPEVVLAAVKHAGYALKFASPELRGDRRVVMEAVRQDGYALEYASQELRGDLEIVQVAIKHSNGYALEYADEKLRGDRDIVLDAVHLNGYAFKYADEKLRGDRAIFLAAVRWDGCVLEYASSELRGDRDIVLEALKHSHGYALQYATEELLTQLKKERY